MIVANFSKLIKFEAINNIILKFQDMKKMSFIVVAFLITIFVTSSVYSQKDAKIDELDMYITQAVKDVGSHFNADKSSSYYS